MSRKANSTNAVSIEIERLWSTKECATYLRRSPRWLWSALTRRPEESGSIPHVRIGSSPRFFPDDIAAWVRRWMALPMRRHHSLSGTLHAEE